MKVTPTFRPGLSLNLVCNRLTHSHRHHDCQDTDLESFRYTKRTENTDVVEEIFIRVRPEVSTFSYFRCTSSRRGQFAEVNRFDWNLLRKSDGDLRIRSSTCLWTHKGPLCTFGCRNTNDSISLINKRNSIFFTSTKQSVVISNILYIVIFIKQDLLKNFRENYQIL